MPSIHQRQRFATLATIVLLVPWFTLEVHGGDDQPKPTRELAGHQNRVVCCAFSPDGKTAFTGSLDNTLRIWDAESGKELHQCKHPEGVICLAVSLDGKQVLTAANKTIYLWDVATGKQLRTFDETYFVWSVDFAPDGKEYLAATGNSLVQGDYALVIRTIDTGKEVSRFKKTKWIVDAAIFSPDGKTVLAGCYDINRVRALDRETWKEIRVIKGDMQEGYSRPVHAAGADRLVTTCLVGYAAVVCDTKTGGVISKCKGHTSIVTKAAISADGTKVLTGSFDKTARLWDATTGKELRVLTAHTDIVQCVALSADGKLGLTGGADRTVRLWQLQK